jgi:hypothetical protein
LENEIRSVPNFEHFQQPLTIDEMAKLAKDGPIVAFNISTDGIETLVLPYLNHPDLERALRQLAGPKSLTSVTLRTLAAHNEQKQKILLWIWDVAVKPILSKPDFLESSTTTDGLYLRFDLNASQI